MTTLDPTNSRTKQAASTLYLSILKPANLLIAIVDDATIARGARTVAYDTGLGSVAGYNAIAAAVTQGITDDIGTSLMAEVTTAYGVKYARVKSITGSRSSGTLTLAENGIPFEDNSPIVIKHFHQIVPIAPAIRSGIFYKDFDRTFTASYATEPNPVAVSQGHLAGFLSAGSIVFTISLSQSYVMAAGASITNYSHACVKNGGGTTGFTIASATAATTTITITSPGTYWLIQTVGDDNGKTQTVHSVIFAHDSTDMPYQDFQLQPFSGDWDSGLWRYTISAHNKSELTLDDIPDGSLCVLWHYNTFNGTEGYNNLWSYGNNIITAGYFWSDNDNDNWQGESGISQASFEVISPLQYLDNITDYGTVSLEATTSPAIWSDYASNLTIGRAVHHLLKWDTTLLDVCNVLNLNSNSYGVKVVEFTEETLLQRINAVAFTRGIHTKLTSTQRGWVQFGVDTQMVNAAQRAALDTIFTLDDDDISGGVNVTRNETTVRAFSDLDGFTYSHPTSTPFIAMIPGYIESTVSYNLPELRGSGVATDRQQVLNPSGGQTDCNERAGRRLALENVSPREVRIATRGNYLGAFEPTVPRLGWYVWGISNNALARELNLNSVNFVCRACTHTPVYDGNIFTGLIHTSEVVLQPEAEGEDGIPGNYPLSYPTIKTPTPTWPGGGGSGGNSRSIMAVYLDNNTGPTPIPLSGFCLTTVPFTTGTVTAIDSINTYSTCGLTTQKGLVVYNEGAGTRARVITASSTVITSVGAEQTLVLGAADVYDVIAMSATKAVIIFNDGANKAAVLTISGDTVTMGATTTLTGLGPSPGFTRGARLSSTEIFIGVASNGAVPAQGSIWTVAATVTEGAYANCTTNNAITGDIAALSSSVVVYVYTEDVAARNLRASVLYGISGGTFTQGNDIELDGTNGSEELGNSSQFQCRSISKIDSGGAVITYRTQAAAPFDIRAIAVAYAGGGNLSAGSDILISSGVQSRRAPSIIATSTTKAIVSYNVLNNGATAYEVRALTVNISGTTLTSDSNEDTVDSDVGTTFSGVPIVLLQSL